MSGFSSLVLTTYQHLATQSDDSVLTFHNDTLRTGQNLNETLLNTSNVNTQHFGKRVSYPVDGQVYTQPLFVHDVVIQGHHYRVVYVATENDSVYAFDADQMHVVAPLWKTSFLHLPDVTAVPSSDVFRKYPNHDIQPQVGITSTPVIDPSTNTMYVVAMTKEHGNQYVQRLHALDITTGKDKPGSPVIIVAQVNGTGYDKSKGTPSIVTFNTREANQRPALLLVNGVIYIAWGSFGDTDPYHGWVLGYTYNGTAFQQVSVYNTTPDGQEGGIWMSGAGPAADAQGNVYLTTANGTFDLAQPGQRDAGDSFVKLSTQDGLVQSDYFTPFNQECLDGRDEDLGSGGVLLLPEQSQTAHPRMLVGVGKEGRIYVIDRDQMGQFHSYLGTLQCNSSAETRTNIDQILQEIPSSSTGGFFGIPGYWAGTATSGQLVYIGEAGDYLKSFQLNGDTLSARATAQTPETFGFPGVTPSISSNKSIQGTGIVWVISPASCGGPGCTPGGPAVLRAYDATTINVELYNSEQNFTRDRLDSYVKFSVPTIANGKVFVGTQTSLNIYGLLTS
ncbi:MAG TPA: hypothetical protein VF026_21885 [Ktedonobacteraceae bacterium]